MDYNEGTGGFGGPYRGGGRREGGRGGFSSSPGGFAPKPVKVGDELEVKVEAIATKGDGIAKKDGFVIFIRGAKEGETIKIRITDVKERFAVGEIIA